MCFQSEIGESTEFQCRLATKRGQIDRGLLSDDCALKGNSKLFLGLGGWGEMKQHRYKYS